MKGKKRISLLAVLVCLFALVLSLGLMSACGNTDDKSASGNWFYGTEAPADGLGNNGDYYLNTETLTAYAKSEDGTWTQTTLYSGHGAPENDAGEAGDLYLDLEKGVLYQKGTNSLWARVLTLQGEKGRDGVLWFSGDKDPDEYTQDDPAVKGAMKGDFYLNTDDFTVWQLTDTGWTCLGTIKGNKGEDAPQFYNGSGAPDTNKDLPAKPNEGDLYLGTFNGLDGKGSGSRLYRYQSGAWTPLMEIMNANQIDIYSLDELKAFAESVNTNSYAGKEVHLKTDIHFETAEASSIRRDAPSPEGAEDWTPIGSADHPFMGIFNGEGHTIFNFTTTASEDATEVGFFGNINGATIEHLHFENVTIEASEAVSGSIGAAVVGRAEGNVKFVDVTVTGATVNGDEDITVGGFVGKLEGEKGNTSLTVEDSSFEGTVTGEGTTLEGFVGDKGSLTDEDITIADSAVTDSEGNTKEWDENGKIVHRVATAQDLIDLMNEREDWSGHKLLLTDDIDTYSVTPSEANYNTEGSRMWFNYYVLSFNGELDGAGHSISLRSNHSSYGNRWSGSLFKELLGGAYIHDIVFNLDATVADAYKINYLNRGAVAYKLTAQTAEDVITLENVTVTGRADGLRAAFIDRCGTTEDTAGTLNFVKCTSDVEVTLAGYDNVDKMAGFLSLPNNWNVNFTDCVNSGNWEGEPTNPAMGGFISYAQGNGSNIITFTRCKNTGNITDLRYGGDPDVGGFIGKVQRETNVVFTDCVNTGTIFCDGAKTISIGGFIGHASGSVTFNGTNVNGEYTVKDGVMTPVEGKGTIKVETSNGTVRAGAFIGFPDNDTVITVNGTLVNAGNVTAEHITKKTDSVTIYAGGLFGQTGTSVTFTDDCQYINLGNVTATVQNSTGSVVYVGGVVGYISGETYTLGTATGYNAGTLTATNADTIYTGSFAGCVVGAGLTDDKLTGFEDKAGIDKKIGHSA